MAFSKQTVIGHENTAMVIITKSKLVNNMVERGPGGVMSLTDGLKAVTERSQLSNSPGGVVYLHMNSSVL